MDIIVEWFSKAWTFINTSSDGLTCIITGVYAIFTLFILMANKKSVDMAKAQVAETKRQHDEDNRAFVEVAPVFIKPCSTSLRFYNHGRINALDTRITLEKKFLDSLPKDPFAAALKEHNGDACIIGAGEHLDIPLGFNTNVLRKTEDAVLKFNCHISYKSNGITYESDTLINLGFFSTTIHLHTFEDHLLIEIRELRSALTGIKDGIKSLSQHTMPKAP